MASVGCPIAPGVSVHVWVWFGLLLAALFAAYSPALHGGILWDDDDHLTPPHMRSWHGLGRMWTDVRAMPQYYPLIHTAFWVQNHLWGADEDSTLGYHVVNVLLHGLAALLVALILRRLAIPGAFLAASIFALHPVQVESVAWITELKNTLSGVFYLAAMLVYLRYDQSRNGRWYILALGLFLCGLLCKTVTATLPGGLLVIFWWQRGRLSWKSDVLPLIPFILLGGGFGLVTAWWELEFNQCTGPEFDRTLVERFLIAGRSAWFQVATLFWPVNLTFIYPRWQLDERAWWQYLYPLGVVALLTALWMIRRWSRAPLAAVLFFGGTLFPVLGFLNLYTFRYSFVADHYQYLACLGIITLVSAGAVLLFQRLGPRGQWGGFALGVVLLATLAILTWRQSWMYRDAVTLHSTTIERNPQCPMAHNNLGLALMALGKPQEAVVQFETALSIKPDDETAHQSWGNALSAMGRHQEALAHYQEALRLKPDYVDAHLSWGSALHALGNPQEAIAHYQAALNIKPDCAEAHNNWGNALNNLKLPQEAIEHFKDALRLKTDYMEAHNNWGMALEALDRPQEAIGHYQAALMIDPKCAEAHLNWGNALYSLRRPKEAIAHYKEALLLRPNFAQASENLALAELSLRQQPTPPRP